MKTIGVYLFNNVEVLDFAGPFEVFSTAQRIHAIATDDPTQQIFKVVTIAEEEKAIVARGGLMVTPMYGIDYHPQVDMLVVPGGVVSAEMGKGHILSWLKTTSERAVMTASVCTGAFLLAQAGLLDGLKATTHWADIDDFKISFPDVSIVEGVRWVDEGNIVTSAGISAGIDMSLHIVERFAGREHAEKTARQMDYRWISDDD